jgi:NADPH-dependent glutamate synthase beta subunit-like oxidoreductase
MRPNPVAPFFSWTSAHSDVLVTGTWRSHLPSHGWRPSPCHVHCPLDGAVPDWMALLAKGALEDAWKVLVRQNPLPAVTGRVCHHPCDSACNRAEYDERLSIPGLERYLADAALEAGWSLPEPVPATGPRVAVVGGGPAGLACAYHLRLEGHPVTIFEARPQLGGLLRYAIPDYRLPSSVLAQEIYRLLAWGLEARVGMPITDEDALAGLLSEHAAVFLALGAQRGRRLAHLRLQPGLPIFDGLEFLAWVKEGGQEGGQDLGQAGGHWGAGTGPGGLAGDSEPGSALGAHIAVLGGGSSAVDVARSAVRLGKRVTLICLERRPEMPAQPGELFEAWEEGVVLLDGAMVGSVVRRSGGRLILRCRRVVLDPAAPLGVPVPLSVEGSDFDMSVDSVVVSIGQDLSLGGLKQLDVRDGLLAVDSSTLATSRRGVFAGGDSTSGERYVSHALAAGRQAAWSISAYLTGTPNTRSSALADAAQAVSPSEVNFHYFDRGAAPRVARDSPSQRVNNFDEVAPGLTAEQARAEARRCLTCGSCADCGVCAVFCPDMAISAGSQSPAGAEERPDYRVLEQYCKGCGLCSIECPRGVIVVNEEQG